MKSQVSRDQYETSCSAECDSDGDCSGDQKCCYNGCGKSCMRVGHSSLSLQPIIIIITIYHSYLEDNNSPYSATY